MWCLCGRFTTLNFDAFLITQVSFQCFYSEILFIIGCTMSANDWPKLGLVMKHKHQSCNDDPDKHQKLREKFTFMFLVHFNSSLDAVL